MTESWLARNIQPITVVFLLFSYFFFALLSVFEMETRGAYVDLLGQAMIIVITAVFAQHFLTLVAKSSTEFFLTLHSRLRLGLNYSNSSSRAN